jgi:hypothetical protein
MKTILAAPNLLKIEKIALYAGEIWLVAKAMPLKSSCPSCGRLFLLFITISYSRRLCSRTRESELIPFGIDAPQ